MNSFRNRANRFLRPLVTVACGYEFLALMPRSKLPTISAMCSKHRWLGPVIVCGLALHLVDMGMNAMVDMVDEMVEGAVDDAMAA